MRTFLLIGATLMVGAAIYGFVDYRKHAQQKAFKNLYTKQAEKPLVQKETPVAAVTEPARAGEVKNTENDPKATPAVTEKKKTEIKKKKRRLQRDLFSRAPLDEEGLEELPQPGNQ